MANLAALTAANTKRWAAANLTRGPEFTRPAKIAFANKSRYISIAKRAGMPEIAWLFIAVSHYRESTQNFAASLAQGDPLADKNGQPIKSVHVPADRGPFYPPNAFEDAAVDALVKCAPKAAFLTDWTIGGMLTNLERFNGLGYANKGIPSPYIWSGTDQYTVGKYVADGVFDPNKVDKQLGCAGLILAIMGLDPSIKLDGPAAHIPALPPAPEAPARDGEWLQTSLNTLGADPQLVVDGIVGPATRNAVRAFQLSKNLVVDGLVGPATFGALDAALAAGKPVPQLPVQPEIVLPPSVTNPSKGSIGDMIASFLKAIFSRKA
jgi:lysozyme family protein